MNFDNDPVGICREVLRVVKHWMSHGVRIFRVDNPHTKPVAFWEWLLKEIRRTDPDVLFLSEAFTRPAMMRSLGAVGFHQSYTYFTWRTAKWELEDYLREVSHESDHTMRPNFFVNTPDILHAYLQYGGPAAFKIRAVDRRDGLPELGRLRRLRAVRARGRPPGQRGVPRLGEVPDPGARLGRRRPPRDAPSRRTSPGSTRSAASTRPCSCCATPSIHSSDDENVLVFSKSHALPDGQSDIVIVVVNLDPHSTRETTVHLDLPRAGAQLGRLVRRPRRDHRPGLELEPAQLRAPRPRPRAGARPDSRGATREPEGQEPRPRRPLAIELATAIEPDLRGDLATRGDRPVPRLGRQHPRLVQVGGLLRGDGPLVPRLQRRRHR